MEFAAVIVLVLFILFGLFVWTKSRNRRSDKGSGDRYYGDSSVGLEESDSQRKGEDFEILVESKLAELERAGAKVIRDCYLRWNSGVTTQIDNILIFRSGIYVIECKDYSGWIFANSSNEYWTQTLRYGMRGDSIKNRFYNPIKQNQNHIKCIRQNLKQYVTIPIYNIVVFNDCCTFKSIQNDSDAWIITASHLYETIWQIDHDAERRLTTEDIEWIYSRLVFASSSGDSVAAEHILNVNRVKNQKLREQYSNGTTCPRCGSPLVLRAGRYGNFYGCMRYPSCKYTRKQ